MTQFVPGRGSRVRTGLLPSAAVSGAAKNRQRPKKADVVAARIEAARQARKKHQRRIVLAAVAGVVIIAAIVGVVIANNGNDQVAATSATTGTTAASDTTSTPTTAALTSAAGKPCVPLADPLPSGAPDVPVQTGPPPTALVSQDLKEGTGAEIKAGDTVTVNYIGVACSTGKIFDSSYSRGQPATFGLSEVIPGWQQGIPGMKIGGQRLLGIPSEMAYGTTGYPPSIAPDEALWFVVEAVSTSAS
jgi:peptidylprolyl isomerase